MLMSKTEALNLNLNLKPQQKFASFALHLTLFALRNSNSCAIQWGNCPSYIDDYDSEENL